MRNKYRGFTLIEVMIVVVIVAILASIALPSYQNSIRKSRRADAHSILQAAQLAQEKFRLNHEIYGANADFSDTAFARVCVMTGGNCMSPGGFYRLTATGPTASGYALTATAVGTQVRDTTCPAINLTQDATGVSYGPSGCWSK
jgi:type IV pilus assembly protein PilE